MKNWKKYLTGAVLFSVSVFIRAYQLVFSPDHGLPRFFSGSARCRFFPSCSEYTLQCLSQYGLLRGGVVSLKRILRCHPLHRGGYDPIIK